MNVHPMILMLLRSLPPPGDVWPWEDQEAFIQVLRTVLEQVYWEPLEGNE